MKITVNQKGTERIHKGHAWVFRSDLSEVEGEAPGVATVVSPKGLTLGQGLYSPQSLIALRMMTLGSEKVTAGLVQERVRKADAIRRSPAGATDTYRAVFGEADFLPSLVVDRYGDTVVFQTLSAGMETFKEAVVETLQDLYRPRSLIERNDASVRAKENLPLIRQVVAGEDRAETWIEIGGRRFGFNPLEGQKTGFFLDQRWNAVEAAKYLEGEVLDAFCYVGQFAIQAAPRAARVLCVDSSEEALAQVRRNAEANGFANIETEAKNAFDFLKDCDQQKQRFDAVCLDPPAFVKSRRDLKQALRGYKEINLRAMRLLKPGGVLVTSSCSQHLSQEEFANVLSEAGRDTRRALQVFGILGQPADHPVLLAMPETNYLKCFLLRVY